LRKGDESSILNQSNSGASNYDINFKLKELETIYQNVALLEKDLKSRYEMNDLNIGSIKRNLELELAIQIKQSIAPI